MGKTPESKKAACRRYYAANREKVLAICRDYAARNKDQIQARGVQYRAENAERLKRSEEARRETRAAEKRKRWKEDPVFREELLRRAREWKSANRDWCKANKKQWDIEKADHVREYGKKRRQAIPERLSAEFRRWRLANPEVMRGHATKRRAAKKGSAGRFTATEIRDLWDRQRGKCAYFSVCGNSLQPHGFQGTHRDHIEPLIPKDLSRKPGANTIDNIQLLCQTCNQRKKNKDPYAFTQQYEGRLFPDLPAVPERRKAA